MASGQEGPIFLEIEVVFGDGALLAGGQDADDASGGARGGELWEEVVDEAEAGVVAEGVVFFEAFVGVYIRVVSIVSMKLGKKHTLLCHR